MSEQIADNATPSSDAPATAATGSLLGADIPATTPQGTDGAGQADAVKSWQDSIPAKFKTADGAINYEAMTKSYLHLEQRLGAGDAPPASADKYAFNGLPEGMQAEQFAGAAKSAHELGLSQKQFDGVMKNYFDTIPQFIAEVVPNPAKAEAQLREVWISQEDYNKNLGLAKKAFSAYAGDDISIDDIGNNAAAIKLLAKIGAGLGEDSPVNSAAILSQESIAELMSSKAYSDPRDPMHQSVHGKIRAHYVNQARKNGQM